MGPNETERATIFPNSTRSVFYCPHEPHLVWDSHDTTSPWVFAAFASIVSPAAVLLNALIIIAVKQRKELQRTSNILLTSLAVTDLLVGSLCIPLSAVVKLLVPHQVLADHYICMLDFVAISSTITLAICSIFHLTVIAWERYVAIRKWIDYKVMVTKSLMKKLAIIAWVLAIVTVSPPNFITALKGMMRANEAVIALEIFLIPLSLLLMSALSLIVYFYVMVYLGVRKRKISQILQVSELVSVKQERRIAMTAAVVTITLILSFVPSILGGMLQGIYLFFRQRLAMRVEDIFLYLNSVANPLIYCYRDRRFRNAVLEILKSRRPKEKPSVVTDAARFGDVKHNDVFGSGKDTLQMRKVENQVRLTRSASCDLTRPVDRAYLDTHKIRLTRTKSSLSLP